jgi:hypothetical protein
MNSDHDLYGSCRLTDDKRSVHRLERFLPKKESLSTQELNLENDHDSKSVGAISGSRKATVPSNVTASLVKSVVGSGVIGLPAGRVARLGDSTGVVLPIIAIISTIGLMNAYFFSLIGRVCSFTGAQSYRGKWDSSVGAKSSDLIVVVVMLKTVLSCMTYSMIIADSFQSLAIAAGLPNTARSQEVLLVVTIVALLPLCCLQELTSLAPFSILGLFGMGFTAYVLTVRFLDGIYKENGLFWEDVASQLQPSFGDSGPQPGGALVLACTLATAFVAHYNAPRFHLELHNNMIQRFDNVVIMVFLISALPFILIALTRFFYFWKVLIGLYSQYLIFSV